MLKVQKTKYPLCIRLAVSFGKKSSNSSRSLIASNSEFSKKKESNLLSKILNFIIKTKFQIVVFHTKKHLNGRKAKKLHSESYTSITDFPLYSLLNLMLKHNNSIFNAKMFFFFLKI